jgi:arginyl-tRNA synthetase
LLDEVGKDAARFFFLMRSPSAHLDFDLDLAREQSEKNPVYYVQYAHARIASLFRQAEASGVTRPRAAEVDADMLTAAEELDLARKLAEFPEEVRLASERQEPHRLTRYAMEVASLYHSFYAHHRVLGSDPGLQAARLYLSHATQVVLRNCLTLLGVSSPEKM